MQALLVIMDGHQEIDDRFCRHAGDGCAADVMDVTYLRVASEMNTLTFPFEKFEPRRIILGDQNGTLGHSFAFAYAVYCCC
jgi:hypothetical protein